MVFVLLEPTATLPKATVVGEKTIGASPVPVRLTICGEFKALSVMVIAPLTAPTTVGVNVTFTVQLAFTARVLQLSFSPKSPLAWMEIVAVAVPLFFSVTLLLALVVPTACLALKVSEVGDAFTTGEPVVAPCETKKGRSPNTAQPVQPEGKFSTKTWKFVGLAMSAAVTGTLSVVEFTNVTVR